MLSQTSHDYLREWFSRRDQELQEILDLEGLPDSALCITCNTSAPAYRCLDCNGGPLYCTECCRSQHYLHPLHRVDHWTGTVFEPSWLWKVGICLDLGHGGAQCPTNMSLSILSGSTKMHPGMQVRMRRSLRVTDGLIPENHLPRTRGDLKW